MAHMAMPCSWTLNSGIPSDPGKKTETHVPDIAFCRESEAKFTMVSPYLQNWSAWSTGSSKARRISVKPMRVAFSGPNEPG